MNNINYGPNIFKLALFKLRFIILKFFPCILQ